MLVAVGCTRAGKRDGGVFIAEEFTLGDPGEDFKLVRNRKASKNLLVAFRHDEARVDLSVNQIQISDDERSIPLVVLAEVVFQNMGRSRGVRTILEQGKRIDIGEHEAYVVVGRRSRATFDRRVGQCFLRAGHELFVVSYIASPEDYEAYAPRFGRALDGFAVGLPADPPEMALPEPPPDWTP